MVIKRVIKNIIQIILLCLIISCSPQKRLNNLVKKHPELIQKDTLDLLVRDTIVIKEQSFDTTTQVIYHDSVTVINNERVILKYFHDTITRELHHYLECKGDTIYKEKIVKVPVDKVIVKELSWWEKYKEFIYIGLVLIMVLIILKKIGKIVL